MDYLDLTLATPEENLALDEALLDEAEEDPARRDVLRLWESAVPAVVLGSGCRFAEDVRAEACLADGVPVLRRVSGGGTVLQGPGCLSYSAILSYARRPVLETIDGAFTDVLARVRSALASIGLDVEQKGTSDLVYRNRKISGSSQRRRRTNVLVHGTLLYRFEMAAIERYLNLPRRQPAYRHNRPHAEFVGNLPADADSLRRALRTAWNAQQPLGAWPKDRVTKLVREKYTSSQWLHRR